MQLAILILNLIASFTSALWAVLALKSPAVLSRSVHLERGEIFYARMYAARAIPLGLAAGLLPFFSVGPAVAWLLFAAAATQLADVAIAIGKREIGMSIGAALGTIVHILCGVAVSQR
jgi:hypothetical protein